MNFITFFRTFFSPIKGRFLYAKKMVLWREKNKHNYTTISEWAPIDKIKVGKYTYGKINAHWYGLEEESLEIGNYCSIADEVHFIMGGEHDYKRFSLYPFYELVFHENYDGICKGPIVVKDDVWIGFGATILSGVTLGQGCVIAARSVVTKDVPPYAIWIGNKVVKFRFNKDVLDKLKTFDYSRFNMKEYKKIAREHLDDLNVDFFIENIGEEI